MFNEPTFCPRFLAKYQYLSKKVLHTRKHHRFMLRYLRPTAITYLLFLSQKSGFHQSSPKSVLTCLVRKTLQCLTHKGAHNFWRDVKFPMLSGMEPLNLLSNRNLIANIQKNDANACIKRRRMLLTSRWMSRLAVQQSIHEETNSKTSQKCRAWWPQFFYYSVLYTWYTPPSQ